MKKRFAFAAVLAAVVGVCALPLVAQNAPPAANQRPANASRPPAQGGTGPIKMLLITKAHPYEREPFYQMFDSFGQDVTWMHVDQPAAEALLNPKYSGLYNVAVFYDMDGQQAELGRAVRNETTREITAQPPSADLQKNFQALLQQGKGLFFLHHAVASWVHSWPEYVEVMGSACDWGAPITTRGVHHPQSGFFGMTPQHISVVDKTHPITQGIGDGFDVIDESYSCPVYEDSVHPLLRTDFVPADHNRNLAPNWKYSNVVGWVKTAENSPIAYIQMGHGPAVWANPTYRKLVLNAIKWTASPEAMAWAKANPTRIFKAQTN
jgi:uncharacterized protein